MNIAEKLKLIRKINHMTQAEFAASIGISRGNLANIELGKVAPTPVFTNCVALLYHVDKRWLLDDNNNDISTLNRSEEKKAILLERYEQLEEPYQKFVDNQILQLLELQHQCEKTKENSRPF